MKRVTRREGRVEGDRGGGGGRGGEGNMVYNQTQGRLDRKRDSRERKVHRCQAKRSMIPLCPEGAQLSLSDTSRCSNLYTSVSNPSCLTNWDIDIELSRVQVEK